MFYRFNKDKSFQASTPFQPAKVHSAVDVSWLGIIGITLKACFSFESLFAHI